jgi:hypothetical protein
MAAVVGWGGQRPLLLPRTSAVYARARPSTVARFCRRCGRPSSSIESRLTCSTSQFLHIVANRGGGGHRCRHHPRAAELARASLSAQQGLLTPELASGGYAGPSRQSSENSEEEKREEGERG